MNNGEFKKEIERPLYQVLADIADSLRVLSKRTDSCFAIGEGPFEYENGINASK